MFFWAEDGSVPLCWGMRSDGEDEGGVDKSDK